MKKMKEIKELKELRIILKNWFNKKKYLDVLNIFKYI